MVHGKGEEHNRRLEMMLTRQQLYGFLVRRIKYLLGNMYFMYMFHQFIEILSNKFAIFITTFKSFEFWVFIDIYFGDKIAI